MNTIKDLRAGKLKGAKTFKYSGGLEMFPKELFELSETLEILDLSGNHLHSLPDNFSEFKKLKIAFFSENNFTVLPDVLSECPNLEMIGFKSNNIKTISENCLPEKTRWLILTNNEIETLPESFGKYSKLQKLMLAGNFIKHIPESFALFKNLELLRISANRIVEFPEFICSLSKLSWLAFGANEFNKSLSSVVIADKYSWNDLQIQECLGEGASGVIFKALSNNKKIAVKVFKGSVTSDGLPETEMHACLQSGRHENLISAIGTIENHKENKKGLVMDLIPQEFIKLGHPPNFETCTRDTFDTNKYFTIQETFRICKEIARAMCHLHKKGIMHGDLYAHNILVNSTGKSLLGDFGAATIYDLKNKRSNQIERLEVRAFGCLIDDLLLRTINDSHYSDIFNILELTKKQCFLELVDERPSFTSIYKKLCRV